MKLPVPGIPGFGDIRAWVSGGSRDQETITALPSRRTRHSSSDGYFNFLSVRQSPWHSHSANSLRKFRGSRGTLAAAGWEPSSDPSLKQAKGNWERILFPRLPWKSLRRNRRAPGCGVSRSVARVASDSVARPDVREHARLIQDAPRSLRSRGASFSNFATAH